MKKIEYIIFILFLCVIAPSIVGATNYVEITGTDVVVRGVPKAGEEFIEQVSSGKQYVLKDKNLVADQGGCGAGWYNIDVNGRNAYVCSLYARTIINDYEISPEAKSQCEQELSSKGFPQSYWNGLCNLRVQHPNWNFVAIQTGLDWASAVASESRCGKNTINTTNASYKDLTCGGAVDVGYSPASSTAIAYYMDPRNFLNEQRVFMFESGFLNTNISEDGYKNAVTNVFGNSFLVQQIPSLPEYIKVGSASSKVNQTMMAARIRQELGNAKLTSGNFAGQLFSIVSGNYTDRYGTLYIDGDNRNLNNYYNFYNIGASDGGDVTDKAMIYAWRKGWGGTGDKDADRQKAVTGGAEYLYKNYLEDGQETIYFQKWNVHPRKPEWLYTYQYMSNVEAPYAEGHTLYYAYQKAGLLNQPFTFNIPIFTNMDANIINGGDGPGQDPGNDTPSTIDVTTMIVASGYKLSGNNIHGISPNTNVTDIKSKIESMGASVTILNGSNTLTSGFVGTGNIIRVSNSTTTKDFTVLIKGDVSGDGVINALDLLRVQKVILKQTNLTDAQKIAADASGDGNINALDLLKIQKHILKQSNIEQ